MLCFRSLAGFASPSFALLRPASLLRLSSSSADDGAPSAPPPAKPAAEWDLSGLRKETDRVIMRTIKKIQKKTLSATSDPAAVASLQSSLASLQDLEAALKSTPKATGTEKEALVSVALSLSLSDTPAAKQPRGPKKVKGPRHSPKMRKIFRTYTSSDGVTILVGKKAEDNDVLSTTWEHRTPRDWWMHASGCAGSHVVIKSEEESLPPATVLEAAALAARASKCAPANHVKVNLTRCRNVSKPPGAKAGLVALSGDIKTVKVDLAREKGLLDKLDATVEVN
jgi:predicted ribosome quality control (RQC) complex YloA/Tae2 family protein